MSTRTGQQVDDCFREAEAHKASIDVGILCFAGADLLDIGGPYEVFLTANRLRAREGMNEPFKVMTVGEPGPVYGGLGLQPTHRVDDILKIDVLVVPGAISPDDIHPDKILQQLAPKSDVLASVCTGSFFLQRNGLLGAGPVTTHWEEVDALDHPDVRNDVRWVDNDSIVTAGGLSSGIAMTLHLVERYEGRELAEATARQIDYVWEEKRPVSM
ncbi:MAG: thiamine biosynthesis protein ThiJ [Gammaproteobacteria bacterium]|nr:MAG: thiamine biosynthesis protein ThiJ [Gammaproteobacteria bacterium]